MFGLSWVLGCTDPILVNMLLYNKQCNTVLSPLDASIDKIKELVFPIHGL